MKRSLCGRPKGKLEMSPDLLLARREGMRLLAESLAAESGVPAVDIIGRCRAGQLVALRHRLWSELYVGGLSMHEIGIIASVDPTSVLYAVRKHLGPMLYGTTVRHSWRRQRRVA